MGFIDLLLQERSHFLVDQSLLFDKAIMMTFWNLYDPSMWDIPLK